MVIKLQIKLENIQPGFELFIIINAVRIVIHNRYFYKNAFFQLDCNT